MSYRNFLCTWNNPPAEAQEALEKLHNDLKATHTLGQLEKGENGTVHLQFTMNFKSKARISKFKGRPIHVEPVKRDNGIHDYVTKEETRVDGPWEYGERPIRRNNKTDW